MLMQTKTQSLAEQATSRLKIVAANRGKRKPMSPVAMREASEESNRLIRAMAEAGKFATQPQTFPEVLRGNTSAKLRLLKMRGLV